MIPTIPVGALVTFANTLLTVVLTPATLLEVNSTESTAYTLSEYSVPIPITVELSESHEVILVVAIPTLEFLTIK